VLVLDRAGELTLRIAAPASHHALAGTGSEYEYEHEYEYDRSGSAQDSAS